MEERMVKMSKSGEGNFYIGGPGKEAFNVALGLQIREGARARFRLPPSALPQRRRLDRHGHAAHR